MYAYYYTEVERPFDKVEEVVLRLLQRFNGWSDEAYRDGETLRTRIGLAGGPKAVAKAVTMIPGTPLKGPSQTRIPIKWEATGPTALFPSMTADLLVVGLGENRTKLAFQGTYDPPMGAVGASLDRLMLHHVAESSVKAFIDRIKAAIEEVVEGDDEDVSG